MRETVRLLDEDLVALVHAHHARERDLGGPDHWDRGIGKRLLEPVVESFERWGVRQAGLFTFASSPKHLGLYQAYGFWPGQLVAILGKPVSPDAEGSYELASDESGPEIRALTDAVFDGLDIGHEVAAVAEQGLGETMLVRRAGKLAGVAVCHCGARSEAGSGTCYVKFGAVAPGETAADDFEHLLDACESFAVRSGLETLAAGVNAGRLDAYRRLLARGFRAEQIWRLDVAAPECTELRHARAEVDNLPDEVHRVQEQFTGWPRRKCAGSSLSMSAFGGSTTRCHRCSTVW